MESTPHGQAVHGVEAVQDGALFTRQATGLVRQVSPLSTMVFNILTSPAPFVLAAAVFWTFGAFPGANLYIAVPIAYGISVLFALAIGLISTSLPRSGGDYILVGRILHPIAGLVSSFCFTAGVLLSMAFFMVAVITIGLAPLFTAAGVVSGSTTLVDWGNTIQTNNGWKFGIGVIALVITCVMAGSGWRWPLRIQNAGFILAAISMIVVAVVLLVNGGDEFTARFNEFAQPFSNDPNTAGTLVATAGEAGLLGGTDWSSTLTAIGAIMGFSMFTWYSIHIAGEVRRASSARIPFVMVGAGLFNMVTVLVFIAIFFFAFDHDLFVAANALVGTPDYPFAAPPTYVFLTAIAGGSSALAWFLGIALLVVVMLMLWLNVVQPVRAMFAYAFDGVFPRQISRVSGRTHVPLVALAITFVITVGLYVWQVWSASFFTVYATGVVFTVAALLLMSISAIVLAYRRPDIWERAVTTRRVAGIPVTTIFGVIAFCVAFFMGFMFLRYPGLGVADRIDALRNVGILAAAAIVTYAVASAVRARQGLSLTKAVSEIPPE